MCLTRFLGCANQFGQSRREAAAGQALVGAGGAGGFQRLDHDVRAEGQDLRRGAGVLRGVADEFQPRVAQF